MRKEKKLFLQTRQKYLHAIYKITKIIIAGNDPSDTLMKEARELGLRVNIPEEELQNLGLVSIYRVDGH